MSEVLFTSQTPSNTNVFEGVPVTVATTVTFAANGTVSGIRFYAPTTIGAGTFEAAFWSVSTSDPGGTGTLLKTATFGTLTPGAWNTISFASPQAVVTGTAYRVGVRTSEGRYTVTNFFWQSTSLTNGNITGILDASNPVGVGTLNNGTFASGLSAYPSGTYQSSCYYMDPVYDASVSGASPTGIGVTAALGSPSVSLNLTGAPGGISSTVALGSPTVALNRSAAPTGISATVTLGQPNVTSTPGPTGISVSVALGTPSVSLNRSAAPSGISAAVSLGSPAAVLISTPGGISVFVSAGSPSVSATVLTAGAPGSWWGIKATDDLNLSYLAEERRTPVACPNDGEPLQRNSRTGKLQCSYDGWIYQPW